MSRRWIIIDENDETDPEVWERIEAFALEITSTDVAVTFSTDPVPDNWFRWYMDLMGRFARGEQP